MSTLRQIIEDAPAYISIPEEYRHRRIELIIQPLPDSGMDSVNISNPDMKASFYELTQEFCGCIQNMPTDLATNLDYMQGFGE